MLRHQTEPPDRSCHRTSVAFGRSEDGGTPPTCTRGEAINANLKCGTPSARGGGDEINANLPCKAVFMVMVPGLFQTLDTLESAVLPLLQAHPRLTVLLVAPPGLPNTHWPANISLNGEVCTVYCLIGGIKPYRPPDKKNMDIGFRLDFLLEKGLVPR